MSKGLDLYQDQCSVGPDLGPNCLQRLSADDKRIYYKKNITIVGQSTVAQLVEH